MSWTSPALVFSIACSAWRAPQSTCEQPRWATYPVSGAFRLRHPYLYADSGGPDVIVTIGKSPGQIDLESMALVAPGEPMSPARLP